MRTSILLPLWGREHGFILVMENHQAYIFMVHLLRGERRLSHKLCLLKLMKECLLVELGHRATIIATMSSFERQNRHHDWPGLIHCKQIREPHQCHMIEISERMGLPEDIIGKWLIGKCFSSQKWY